MRQVWITRAGAPEVLQVREAPDPEPAKGQVRVRVKAAGINFADLMARMGLYPDAPKLPCVVGYEVSGVVDRVGEGVTGLHEGDRVLAMPRFGGYTDCLVVPEDQAFRMPEKMTFEHGAAPARRLPHGVQHDALHRDAAARVLGAHPLGGRRGGPRGDPDREDAQLHHPRHGLAGQARLPAAERGGAPDRLGRRLRGRGARRSSATRGSTSSSTRSAGSRGRPATSCSPRAGASWPSGCRPPARGRSGAFSTRPRR